ncbi:hypothetical protein [Pedobacter nutrimenti]|uniref:hypothetical protein n=1 Tax=Pedobacter nutrimenti TaxID=1241337 RepID=UPI00292DEC5C|nr:hypothetical protein [Pedobacter nutrimenti]
MGLYMTVVLKEQHKNDFFIDLLNQELTDNYGANTCSKFASWQDLKEDVDYINFHPEGLKQLTDCKRPLTMKQLQENFYWFRVGEFSFKLSGDCTCDDSRDAVAVCKWLSQTKCKYIDKRQSSTYSKKIVSQYFNPLFEEEGYDLQLLWKQR